MQYSSKCIYQWKTDESITQLNSFSCVNVYSESRVYSVRHIFYQYEIFALWYIEKAYS